MSKTPFITNDAVVLGILFLLLFGIFWLEKNGGLLWSKINKVVPPILLCYFLPGVLNTFGVIDAGSSQVYSVISTYFLPVCLLLFTLGLDIQMLKKLGPKAVLVFLAGTLGIVIGGPIAVLIVKSIFPSAFSGENVETWRGLATIAGSWIGGGANQTALKEVFQPSAYLFSQAVAVDILVAESWLAVLLIGVANVEKLDKFFGGDTQIMKDMQQRMNELHETEAAKPIFLDYLKILAVGFGGSGLAYACADVITPYIQLNYPDLAKFSLTSTFFWVVVIATFIGILLSQTKVSKLTYRGSNEVATVFLYILIASIGMQMDLFAVADNLALFLVGFIWILVHVGVIVLAGKLLKVPFFFVAVGSQANVGGAASASVVAGAFNPTLISVGVLLSILGYAVGTYAGYITTLLMQWASS